MTQLVTAICLCAVLLVNVGAAPWYPETTASRAAPLSTHARTAPTEERHETRWGELRASAGSPGQHPVDDVRSAKFSHPLRIDNRWTPMVPGSESIFDGSVKDGSHLIPHRIVSIVTDMTKVVDGVRTAVVWERDYSAGVLEESELFFVAQADDGIVWLFGEYPELWHRGHFRGAPSTWIAGSAGARPGIFMLASPRVGTPSYSQGIALGSAFYDRAKVFATGHRVCIPRECYRDVLVIDEWGPLAPADGHQRKSYVAGLGTIRVAPVGGDRAEVLALTRVRHLSVDDTAALRKSILAAERRAYDVIALYGQTPPATPRRG